MKFADDIGSYKTNGRFTAAFSALIKPAGVRVPVLLLAVALSGCGSFISSPPSLELMSRDTNAVSHGTVSSEYPLTTRIVIDIDRRIYMGTSEPTAPNNTFGWSRIYGPNRYSPAAAAAPGGNRYYKAILSSEDRHVLRCDLTHSKTSQRDGLCVDDFGRVYDVVSTR